MKRVLLTIGVLFTSQSFAAAPVFCSSPTMAYQSDCTSTCSAIAAAKSYSMDFDSYYWCEGQSTKKTVDIRKIELGKTEIGNESRCTIWEGNDINFDLSAVTGDLSSKNPITLKNCTAGVTYDAVYVTLGRYEKMAGYSVFPDGTEKIVRTTSVFSGKDTGHTNLTSLNTWRDTGLTDDTLQYTIPNSGSPGKIFKKIVTTASNDNLDSSSNVVMYWDALKAAHSTHSDAVIRPGFYCHPNNLSDPNDSDPNDCFAAVGDDKYVSIVPDVSGLPITLKTGDETLNITYTRYKSNRGTNKDKGLEFMWYKTSLATGGVLKYAGARSTDDGGYLEISNVRSNDGL